MGGQQFGGQKKVKAEKVFLPIEKEMEEEKRQSRIVNKGKGRKGKSRKGFLNPQKGRTRQSWPPPREKDLKKGDHFPKSVCQPSRQEFASERALGSLEAS